MKPQKKDYVLLVVSLLTFASSAASFDCRQALLPDEKTICAIPQLSELDVELYVKYHFVKGLTFMGGRGELEDSQHKWLQSRHQCGADIKCLKRHYHHRIKALDGIYQAFRKPVPLR
ncbi:TPA: lysozyme inhibitor LprI family protein [Salmonella enterica]